MANLRARRIMAGLTQQNVADILEISRQTVSAWENGSKAVPCEREIELMNLYMVVR